MSSERPTPVSQNPPALAPDGRQPESLLEIYRAHGEQVAKWALRLGGPGFDAQEALQEVFARVGENLEGFRRTSKTSTWLYAITENVVREQRRRSRRWRFFWLDFSAAQSVAAPRPLPLEDVERREATALLYRALDRMKEPYRTAIILFEIEGLSGEQLAELKGVPVSTVWVWLHRARAKLAEHLQDLGGYP